MDGPTLPARTLERLSAVAAMMQTAGLKAPFVMLPKTFAAGLRAAGFDGADGLYADCHGLCQEMEEAAGGLRKVTIIHATETVAVAALGVATLLKRVANAASRLARDRGITPGSPAASLLAGHRGTEVVCTSPWVAAWTQGWVEQDAGMRAPEMMEWAVVQVLVNADQPKTVAALIASGCPCYALYMARATRPPFAADLEAALCAVEPPLEDLLAVGTRVINRGRVGGMEKEDWDALLAEYSLTWMSLPKAGEDKCWHVFARKLPPVTIAAKTCQPALQMPPLTPVLPRLNGLALAAEVLRARRALEAERTDAFI